MRFPKRIRGLVLGAVTLIAGPIVAIAMTSAPAHSVATVAASTHLSAAPAQHDVRIVQEPLVMRPRTTLPATPAPTPTPTPAVHRAVVATVPASKGSIVAIIEAAAARWGVSGTWMVSIARCESGLNPRAVNPSGPYDGLFQFLPSTFYANGGTNIWDPTDQSNITAKMLAHGQAHQWSCA